MEDLNRKNIIGSRIMQRRKQLGIKQSELAELIGVSDNQISNIENGKSFTKFSNFILICNALECNADYFISGIINNSIDKEIEEMILTLSIEEQKTIWKLIDCYIHRNDVANID